VAAAAGTLPVSDEINATNQTDPCQGRFAWEFSLACAWKKYDELIVAPFDQKNKLNEEP
jgi:hypothetical protein